MILSDRSLREAIEAGRIVVDPFDPMTVQPSSIDVRVDRGSTERCELPRRRGEAAPLRGRPRRPMLSSGANSEAQPKREARPNRSPGRRSMLASYSRIWSGRRESNPHCELGKLVFYH